MERQAGRELDEEEIAMEPIDWSRVADLYDAYVDVAFDIPFFLREARQTTGEVLELMSGTGRVSVPLLEAGVRLVCVDRSPEMLAVLRAKLAARGLAAPVYEMDVCALALDRRFPLILLPFHSFAEILSPEDQRRALASIYAHLADGGRFVCTLGNPRVRLQLVDSHLRLRARRALAGGQTLLLWVLETHDETRRVVDGAQFYEIYDARGELLSKRMLELHFRVPEREEFEALAADAGFHIAALYGNYDAAPFEPETSPFMVWILER